MARRTIGSILGIVTLGFGCGSEPSPDATVDALLRLGAVNLGLNANQPDVRERQDLYLSTAPGTDHSFGCRSDIYNSINNLQAHYRWYVTHCR